jgi:hypothetical protein
VVAEGVVDDLHLAAGDEWAQQRGVGFQAWWSMPLGEKVGWTPVRGVNST